MMKRSALVILFFLVFGALLKYKAQPLVVSPTQSEPYCNGFLKGSVDLNISGGHPPYTILWNDNNNQENRSNLSPGHYSYLITDVDLNEINGSIQLMSCVRWFSTQSINVNDNTVIKLLSNGWNAGTNSLNQLQNNEDGFVTYNILSPNDHFSFGIDYSGPDLTLNYTDIKFAFRFESGEAEILIDGSVKLNLGGFTPGDEFKISKEGSNIKFYQNQTLKWSENADPNDLRIEVALFNEGIPLEGIKSTFMAPKLDAEILHGNLSEDHNNSGYLHLNGKGGLKPYTYKWDNSETKQTITFLSAGKYRGVITDSIGDSVVVYRSIGYPAGAQVRNNLSFTEHGLTKTDMEKKANLSLDRYIPSNENGWLEFRIKDKNQEFNVVYREFEASNNPDADATPPVTEHTSENIVLSESEINYYQNLGLYQSLNIFSSEYYPQSILVEKQKFVDMNGLLRSSQHGVVCRNGKMYILFEGATIFKPILLADGDVIKIEKQNDLFLVELNGIVAFSHAISRGPSGAFDINMTDYNLLLWYLIHGGSTPWPKGTSCNSNPKNWSSITEYDGYGNIVSQSKTFFDVIGRPTQSLNKDITRDNVIATQILYDSYGRYVLNTLPAPTFQSSMCYVDNFFNNQNYSAYNVNDFDIPNYTSNPYNLSGGERDVPKAVDAFTKGGVGWYYSNNNDAEPFVPTAETPYQRVEYDITNPSNILRSSKAGLELQHGGGHEVYDLSLKAAGELYYFYGFGNSWIVTDMNSHFNNYSACRSTSDIKTLPMNNLEGTVTKKIHMDENGSESVVFYDANENQIGRCLSGAVDGVNQQSQAIIDFIDIDPNSLYNWVDVHLPEGCQNSLILEQNNNQFIYDIINLKTGRCDQCGFGALGSGVGGTGTQPVLSPGSYRIKLVSTPAMNYSNLIRVRYNTNYYNFTANYFDRANRLRITVPPEGLSYSGGALMSNYYIYNGTVAKKFVTTDNHAMVTYGGAQPNVFIQPNNWELGSGSGSQELSLNCVGVNYLNHNFIVRFSGKNTAWSMTHFGDETNPAEAYRQNNAQGAASGDLLKLRYELDGTEEAYSKKLPEYQLNYEEEPEPLSKSFATSKTYNNIPSGFWNGFSQIGGFCTSTVMPVVITYQIVDGSNQPISGSNVVTGYCTIVKCVGNTVSYSKTWSFPPQNVHFLNGSAYPNSFTARLKILNIYAVQNTIAYPSGSLPWQLYNDITADFSWKSGQMQGSPAHNMTDVNEYNSIGQLIISKKPDSGETDYIYSPDGSIRAIQNSKQDIGGTANTDQFSYVNYDSYGRIVEKGEYDRSLTSGNPNVKFKNYKEFLTNSSAPSMIIEANNNNSITDAGRKKEVTSIVYDQPDPNFISHTSLSPTLFEQEYLSGKVSYTKNDNKWTWYSYDELGRVKWMVNRYNGIQEAASPSSGVTIKTFYYKYDYLGNVTEKNYQYHLGNTSVVDKMKQEYFYDSDKRLVKVQSTFYDQLTPVTKTDAEYFYYLHGPLKRVELAGNLQGIDYIYTLNGQLKGINSPELDITHDPGQDGAAIGGRLSYPDLFGMTLDYFNGDYERAFTKVQTYLNQSPSSDFFMSRYNGDIMAQRWQIKEPIVGGSGMSYQNKQLIYGYWYDKKNQMTLAQFGEVTNNELYQTKGGNNKAPEISIGEDYRVINTYDANGNITSLSRNAHSSGANGLYMDDLSYNYIPCSNKLNYASDAVNQNLNGPDPYSNFGFAAGQSVGNYLYSTLGQLTEDISGSKKYEYNSDGQITKVRNGQGALILEYLYDDAKLRILKIFYDPVNPANTTKTLYVRDNEGNIVAVYEKPTTNTNFSVKEWNIIGESRIATAYYVNNKIERVYEIDDHLGSVRATFGETLKTSISTYFGLHMKSDDFKYFIDPNNTLVQFQAGNGYSRVYSSSKIKGIESIKLPANIGHAINVNINAKYAGINLPAGAALVVEFYNNSNILISSNFAPVTAASQNDNWSTISTNLTNNSSSDGYFKVFVKNTSTIPADFDNIQITFSLGGGVRIPLQLDAMSYYPHGSEMPGLTFHTSLGARYGYQGQFAEKDSEIGEHFFELRNYNPLLGRFNTIDPEEQYHSPYMAMGNNHPNSIDPTGGLGFGTWAGAGLGFVAGAVITAAVDYYGSGPHNEKGKFDLHPGWYVGSALVGFGVGGIAGGIIEKGGLEHSVIFGRSVHHAKYTKKGFFGWYTEPAQGTFVHTNRWSTIMDLKIEGPAASFDLYVLGRRRIISYGSWGTLPWISWPQGLTSLGQYIYTGRKPPGWVGTIIYAPVPSGERQRIIYQKRGKWVWRPIGRNLRSTR